MRRPVEPEVVQAQITLAQNFGDVRVAPAIASAPVASGVARWASMILG